MLRTRSWSAFVVCLAGRHTRRGLAPCGSHRRATAERKIVEIEFEEPVTPAVIRYMNRLSDLRFVLARVENDQGGADALWEPGATANTGRASAVD